MFVRSIGSVSHLFAAKLGCVDVLLLISRPSAYDINTVTYHIGVGGGGGGILPCKTTNLDSCQHLPLRNMWPWGLYKVTLTIIQQHG